MIRGQVTRSKEETEVVLTRPLSIDGESESEVDYKAPNLIHRILSLFKNVRPGSDLTTHFKASSPSSFFHPKLICQDPTIFFFY